MYPGFQRISGRRASSIRRRLAGYSLDQRICWYIRIGDPGTALFLFRYGFIDDCILTYSKGVLIVLIGVKVHHLLPAGELKPIQLALF